MSTTKRTKRSSWQPGDDTGALSTSKSRYLSPEYAPAPATNRHSYHSDTPTHHHHAHPVHPNNHHLKNHLHHGGHGHGRHLSYAASPVSGHYYDGNAPETGRTRPKSSSPGDGELNGSRSGFGQERRGKLASIVQIVKNPWRSTNPSPPFLCGWHRLLLKAVDIAKPLVSPF